MTTPPLVDVTFRKQKRKNGWFLVEQWKGRGDLEYGPMREDHVEPLMNQIVAQHEAAAKASADAATQNLAAMARPAAPRGFNPQQESAWLRKQNPLKRK